MLHFEKRNHTPSAWLANKPAASLPWCHYASDGFSLHLSHSHSLPFPQHNISTTYCTSSLSAAIIRRPVERNKRSQSSHILTSAHRLLQVTEYFPIYRMNTLVPIVVSYRGPIVPITNTLEYRSAHTSPTH